MKNKIISDSDLSVINNVSLIRMTRSVGKKLQLFEYFFYLLTFRNLKTSHYCMLIILSQLLIICFRTSIEIFFLFKLKTIFSKVKKNVFFVECRCKSLQDHGCSRSQLKLTMTNTERFRNLNVYIVSRLT